MNVADRFHNWRRKQRWNKQYRSGRWENLKGEKERVRYEKIVELTEKHGTKNPNILDLGSGEGVLLDYFNVENITSFYGMDFSSVSIKKANKENRNKATFICADLHNFTPEMHYDVIVLNEAFYYIHETKKRAVIDTMAEHLKPNGIILVSIYREGLGCWEYFKNDRFEELDFSTITTNEEKTYWKIGAYKLN
ncbi:trans-aconitate 2-methyltransferase [Lacinutrix sp. Hel_I_90]|uniref:class I SAM-dependent methyltransferase n=1 Tax=Lacinutrix sp. Hel_I_90 TaxID=1249999 RepID=UPI0005CAF39F|nr:class I SAM-dependent methyltransferase [Lacinutrix sp. Hel_I_90]